MSHICKTHTILISMMMTLMIFEALLIIYIRYMDTVLATVLELHPMCRCTIVFQFHINHCLTHWGRVTHIWVGRLTNIDSDDGLSSERRQAIVWKKVGILLIGPLGTKFREFLIEIHIFSFKKMHLKMSSAKWRPYCLGLNVLTYWGVNKMVDTLQTFSNAFSFCIFVKISLNVDH